MHASKKLATIVTTIVVCALVSVACSRSKESPANTEKQAFEDVRAEVRSAVADPDRAAEVVDLVDQLEQSFLETRKNVRERRAALRALTADYDATREDFRKAYEHVKKDIRANRDTMVTIHRRMIDAMTEDEWSQVQKAQSKALLAAVNVYNSI